MHSSMIGKLDKARRYADEPWRASMQQLQVEFKGDNDTHTVSYADGAWRCTCHFFEVNDTCAHSMAVQRMIARAFTEDGVDHGAHLLASQKA
jgi:hypothetical protein